MVPKRKQDDDDEGEAPADQAPRDEVERGVPEFGMRNREPITQGERLRWIRQQLGPDMWTPMRLIDMANLLYELTKEGDGPRATTTIMWWERDVGRGPTLKEGVALARLVGKTADWLSGLDEFHATLKHQHELSADVLARVLKQGYRSHKGSGEKPETPGARGSGAPSKGHGPTSSTTRPSAAKKRRKNG